MTPTTVKFVTMQGTSTFTMKDFAAYVEIDGCQWCGCPEYHDGEECPSEAAKCICGNQRSLGYGIVCYTCVNAERSIDRAETMGY